MTAPFGIAVCSFSDSWHRPHIGRLWQTGTSVLDASPEGAATAQNASAPDSIESRDARSNSPPPKSAPSQASLACRLVEWLGRATVDNRKNICRSVENNRQAPTTTLALSDSARHIAIRTSATDDPRVGNRVSRTLELANGDSLAKVVRLLRRAPLPTPR